MSGGGSRMGRGGVCEEVGGCVGGREMGGGDGRSVLK